MHILALLALITIFVLPSVFGAEDDYCCITPNSCIGAEELYGGQSYQLTKAQLEASCLDSGYEWDADTRCSEISRCITGCCVFKSTSGAWDYSFDVQQQSCMDSYEMKFFVPLDAETMRDESQCDAYFRDSSFQATFNVVDETGNQVSIDTQTATITKIDSGETCSVMPSTNPNFNYAIQTCTFNGQAQSELPFGVYRVEMDDGADASFTGTIDVFQDDTYTIVLSAGSVPTGTLHGFVTDAISGNDLAGATITISEFSGTATSTADGSYTLADIPVLFDGNGDPLERTVTVILSGYNPWVGSVVVYAGEPTLNVRLVPSDTSGTQTYCCANDIGCAPGVTLVDASSCYAGNGKYGHECPGSTPLEACAVPAPFCCASVALCNTPTKQTGCSGVDSVACAESCAVVSQCAEGTIHEPCICNGKIEEGGVCCSFGNIDIYDSDAASCDELGHTITGVVIGKPRYETSVRGLAGAEVHFTSTSPEELFFTTNTDADGAFTITLPHGAYYATATAPGFSITPEPHYFTLTDTGEHVLADNPSGPTHPFPPIECLFDGDDECDDFSSVVDDPENEWPSLTPGDYHHLFYLEDKTKKCDSAPGISSAWVEATTGKKELVVHWDIEDCQELSWFIIEKCYTLADEDDVLDTNAPECIEIAQVSAGERSYTDEDVSWSQMQYAYNEKIPIDPFGTNLTDGDIPPYLIWEYNYSIRPVYLGFNGAGRPGTEAWTQTVRMGDRLCEGREAPFEDEFCAYSMDPDYVSSYEEKLMIRSLRVKCDENNFIVATKDTNANNPADCSLLNTDDDIYACFGPRSGVTSCEKTIECSSLDVRSVGPFGIDDSAAACRSRSDSLCVYQPDNTLVDSCMSCFDILDCTDYTSADSCGADTCSVGRSGSDGSRCTWINTAFSAVGEGICLPSRQLPSENFCSEASRANNPFSVNMGWSDELCAELGNCIASQDSGCKSCDEYQVCEAYSSKEECLGFDNIPLSITYPVGGNTCGNLAPTEFGPDQYYSFSQDGCERKFCNWNAETSSCFRDANANGVPDNDPTDGDIISSPFSATFNDYSFPVAQPTSDSLIISTEATHRGISVAGKDLLIGADIDYAGFENWFGFRYCIDKDDVCCPDLTLDAQMMNQYASSDRFVIPILNDVDEPVASSGVDEDGIYYLRYIAQGTNFNIAPLSSKSFFVDRTAPTYVESHDDPVPVQGSDQIESRVAIHIESTGIIAGTENREPISCEYELCDVRGSCSFTPIAGSTPEGVLALDHTISYLLPDGLYTLRARCEDSAGNVNTTGWEQILDRIRVDQNPGFDILSPPDLWVIGSHERVIFSVKTEVPATCTLYKKGATGDTRELVSVMATTDDLVHTYIEESIDPTHSKMIYDGDYEVNCIENEATCEGTPEVCTYKDYTSKLVFGVDTKKPITMQRAFGYMPESDVRFALAMQLSNETPYIGNYYHRDNVTFTFDCYDPLISSSDSNVQLSAGCLAEQIAYCFTTTDGTCEPRGGYVYGSGPFPEQESSFGLCYRAVDLIDSSYNDVSTNLRNWENTKCVNVFIDRHAPEITLTVDSGYQYGEAYITDGKEIHFSGYITDPELDETDIYMITASGHKIDDVKGYSYDPLTGYFEGYFQLVSDLYNAYGSNKIVVSATDVYGNTGTKQATVFFDTLPPVVLNYKINNVPFEKKVEYSWPFNLSFTLDDVFWTHELHDVTVNVIANSPYNSYELGVTPLHLAGEDALQLYPAQETTVTDEEDGSFRDIFEDPSVYTAVKELISSMYSGTLSPESYNVIVEDLGDWKTYSIPIKPEFNDFTRLFDIGIGEYIIELRAKDYFNREVRSRFSFNVSDSTPPEIFLVDPRNTDITTYVTDGEYYTNNINQILEVHTDDAATCYFDFGSEPSTAHQMSAVNDQKTIHRYMLQDFEPFERQRTPFVITCSQHGTDLTAQQFIMEFDRAALDLDLDVSTGKKPVLTTQKHIAEYQLDYNKIYNGELQPTISITDVNDKPITCSFTCKSPNSLCKQESGRIGLEGVYEAVRTKQLNLEGIDETGVDYAWGDYIYEITCADETGNIGKTQDLALSIRSNSAPQQLFILDASPREEVESGTVRLKVVTNMLSTCEYRITSPSGLPADLAANSMDDQARLTHIYDVDLGNGAYTVSYACELSTNPAVVKTRSVSFDVLGTPSFTALEQYGNLPIFTIRGAEDAAQGVSYVITDKDVAATVDATTESFNSRVILVPEIGQNKTLHAKIIDAFGRASDEVNITSVADTLELSKRPLDYFSAAQASASRPVDAKNGIYTFNEDDMIIGFSFTPDEDTDIYVYIDDAPFTNVDSEFYATAGSYGATLFGVPSGFHDVFILIKHSEGIKDEYVHFKYNKNIAAPQIVSVGPDYMNGNTLNVEVSKPATCLAMYPSTTSRTGQAVAESPQFATKHTLTLTDLKVPDSFKSVVYVTVICSDGVGLSDQQNHLVQIDTTNPKINTVDSDNSILEVSGTGIGLENQHIALTTVRDEDAHLILNVNEFVKCTATDEDGNTREFDDYFLANLHPHVALYADDNTRTYTIQCKDEAGNPSQSISVDVTKDTTLPLYIHDVWPLGPTNDPFPIIEAYTFRDAKCDITVKEANPDSSALALFFKTLGDRFNSGVDMDPKNVGHKFMYWATASTTGGKQRTALAPGVHYKAVISCRSKGLFGVAGDTYETEFWYDGTADSRPQIYIE